MVTCSSILAWIIPQVEEPGGLQSMGSQRVQHDWAHTNIDISLLRSFNGPEPGGLELTYKKVKGEKEADIPWFMQKANEAPAWGLLCSRRPQAPSWWGKGAECLLKRVLEAWAGKWTQRASALQGSSLKKRGRERKRKTRGPELWWSKVVLINMVWAYILSYKVVLSKDKD